VRSIWLQDALHERSAECDGLAGSGAPAGEHVAPLEHGGDGGRLDRERRRRAHVRQHLDDVRSESEIAEGHIRDLFGLHGLRLEALVHDVLDLLVLRTAIGGAVPVAAARSVGAARAVIPTRTIVAARALGAVEARAVERRAARAVVPLRTVAASAVVAVVPRAVIALRTVAAIEPRTVIALRTVAPIEPRTVITLRTIAPVEPRTVITLRTIAPVEPRTVITLRTVVPVETRTLGPAGAVVVPGTVIPVEPRTVIRLRTLVAVEPRTLGPAGAIVVPRAVVATGTVVPVEAGAVIPAVRCVDASRFGAVADRARLVAAGALLRRPTLLRRTLARRRLGAVAAVARGAAAGTRVHAPVVAGRTGIAIESAAAGLAVAGGAPLVVAIVEGGLLRVTRLEVRRGASTLGLVVLGHGYVLCLVLAREQHPAALVGRGETRAVVGRGPFM